MLARFRPLLVLLPLLTLAACAPEPPSEEALAAAHAEAVAAIEVRAAAFSEAYKAGDVDAMVDSYTQDAVLLPTNAEYIRGRAAIRRYWTLSEGRSITHHRLTPVEIDVSGTLAADFGTYEIAGLNGDQAWGPTYGKYLVVWRLEADGQWRMQRDMWNPRSVDAPAGN